jgi:hypothetical protein
VILYSYFGNNQAQNGRPAAGGLHCIYPQIYATTQWHRDLWRLTQRSVRIFSLCGENACAAPRADAEAAEQAAHPD